MSQPQKIHLKWLLGCSMGCFGRSSDALERIHLAPLISDCVDPADCAAVYADMKANPGQHIVPIFDWRDEQ